MEAKKSDNKEKPRPGKKAYKKPEFRYERAFETMADYRTWCETQLPEWLGYGR